MFPHLRTSSLLHYAIKKCSSFVSFYITEYSLKYGFPDPSLWIFTHKILFYHQFETYCSTFMGKVHSVFTQVLNQTSFHDFSSNLISLPQQDPQDYFCLCQSPACPYTSFSPAPDLTLELRNTLQLMPRELWLDSNLSLNKTHGKSQLCNRNQHCKQLSKASGSLAA